ncbi:MAG TPA: methyltransferase domain-containing protein [Caulobacteraceae bacterium]|jgi:SAM-dependent methyltransferase|nr:methyltransferase domain-containing protein [Caulobacteraceae bacterium]
MRQGVSELAAFYASPLGGTASRMVSRKVAEAWRSAAGLDLLAVGYATPFVGQLDRRLRRVVAAMPAAQGVERWPPAAANAACLVDEGSLPFPNAFFDRVLAAHALEESDSPSALLAEIARVLSPSGRVILVAAARSGAWAHVESTPFGQGRAFTRGQLERLVREADLTPTSWTRALYAPPARWAARWGVAFEQVGAWLWPGFSGLVLMEATKMTPAVRPRGAPARAGSRRPVFSPAPIGGNVNTPVPVGRDLRRKKVHPA